MALHTPPSTQARYQYKPLQIPDEIRLLQLYPESDLRSPHVRCEIHHVKLSNPPPYEALSYVWGAPEKDFIISCGNQSYISLTKSLHTALCDLRDPNKRGYNWKERNLHDFPNPEDSLLFWADGICINQDDIDERNHQVTLMGDIYAKARRVMSYIGEGNDERYTGIILGVQLQQFVHKNYSRLPDPRMQDLERLTEFGFPHHADPMWGHLRDVCNLPWSSRMWIVQESLLNPNIVMRCGRLEFPWNVLGEIHDLVARGFIPKIALTDRTSPHVGVLFTGTSSEQNHLGVMTTLRKSANLDFQELKTLRLLLNHCHSLRSTDPRDKIYALLNIAKDAEKLDITPDYSRAPEKLYTDVAIRIIQSERNLDLLASVYPLKNLKMPSWVPDWSSQPGRANLLEITSAIHSGIYAASGTTTPEIKFNEQTDELTVTGAFVDRISYVTEVIGPMQFRRKPQWFNDMLNQLSSPNLQLGGARSPLEALWRTLLANMASFERLKLDTEAPDDYELYFDAFVKLQGGLSDMEKGIDFAITQKDYDMAQAFDRALSAKVADRALCRTEKGFLGLVPTGISKGDDICVFLGGRTPYILRRLSGDTTFLGEVYVHGLMKGESFGFDGFKLEKIVISKWR